MSAAHAGLVSLVVCIAATAPGLGQTPGFYPIAPPPGTSSTICEFTLDGSMAVGHNNDNSPPFHQGYRWTAESGRMPANELGLNIFNGFEGISSDGSVVVGVHWASEIYEDTRTFILAAGQPLLTLPLLAPYTRSGTNAHISGDGLVVAGTLERGTSSTQSRAFRWTNAGGILAIPLARTGDYLVAVNGISRDGTTIVGSSANPAAGTIVAWCWREGMGTVQLPSPLLGAEAHATNADGSVIVGEYYTATATRAVYWDFQRQMHDLGSMAGATDFVALSVSDDGRLVGGFAGDDIPSSFEAFLWTADSGIVGWRDYFSAREFDFPPGYRAHSVASISSDMRKFALRVFPPTGTSISAVVVLPRPCPADFNRDGGVDGSDVEAFFIDWSLADPDADVNDDGGIDGADVASFFHSWEAGGCV